MWQRFSGILMPRFFVRLALSALALAATPGWTQGSAGLVGIWEPVNYSEDLSLTDVFFVTPEIGYVSGAAGTILKTTDAGATWVPLLGGDPASQERAVNQLWFVSPTVGWATQIAGKANLFRTRDGETWEQIGTIDEHYDDLAFSSETDGIFINDKLIYRTQDGGKTWKNVHQCTAKAQIDGLSRKVDCNLWKLRFASPTVVYALGAPTGGVTAAVILKSVDAGASWSVAALIEDHSGTEGGLFFVDENTGYFSTHYGKAAFRTTDGGQTWTGMPATQVHRRIIFADPEIGWTLLYNDLSYTTDGGRRWSSRSIPFPAKTNAFSLPRRDVAYVVGDHGMIYRYRVVPEGTPQPPHSLSTVAMPPLANGIIDQLDDFETGLDDIESAFESMDEWPADDGSGEMTSWVDDYVSDFGEFEDFEAFEATADFISTGLPELGRKHRNLNLVIQGLTLLSDLSAQGGGLKQAMASLREANDVNSVSAALLQLNEQLEASKASVEAFQNVSSFGQ